MNKWVKLSLQDPVLNFFINTLYVSLNVTEGLKHLFLSESSDIMFSSVVVKNQSFYEIQIPGSEFLLIYMYWHLTLIDCEVVDHCDFDSAFPLSDQ